MITLASCLSFDGLSGGAPGAGGEVSSGPLPIVVDASGSLSGEAGQPSGDASGPLVDGADVGEAAVAIGDAASADAGIDAPVATGLAKLFIFAGYEGGPFTIDVDVDHPEIVIGLVAAQPLTVTITGAYKARVTAVHFVGTPVAVGATTVTGIAPERVSSAAEPSALGDVRGNSKIRCQYEGGARYNDASCNTREQVASYFKSMFSGTVLSHSCQYTPYSGTKSLSVPGACDCAPTTCALEGKGCGAYPDGCGGSLNCGGCAGGTCGGFGVPNQCGGCAAGQSVAGPRSPGSIVDKGSFGTRAWTDPDAAGSSDDARASISAMTGFETSHYVYATDFGFSLPLAAVPKGIYLEVERANDLPFESFVDASIRLATWGVLTGNDRKSATPWAPSDLISVPKDHVAVYGGANDTWGTNLSYIDVNVSSFGVAVAVKYNAATGTGYAAIDAMRMWICY